jgi:HSP20 family molecular chaperone IbpA
LPHAVNREKVEATYASGVLTIRLPKAAGEKSKVVEVKVK